jgi:hypothetical protein
LAQLAIYRLDDDYYDSYLSRLAAVDLNEVHAASHRHLASDRWRVVAVGAIEPLRELRRITQD